MSYQFKIYGERNSGTRYLEALLKLNFDVGDYELYDRKTFITRYWKHGTPKNDIYEKITDKKVIHIFIYRDIYDWLISMYHNPYVLNIQKWSFDEFLTKNLFIKQLEQYKKPKIDYYTGKLINYYDENKKIFDVRYYKLNSYLHFCSKNSDYVIIKLDYLQNNWKYFLKKLNNCFKLGKDIDYRYLNINNHTKNKKNNTKNRTYSTTDKLDNYISLINNNINIKTEQELPIFAINNGKLKMFKKNKFILRTPSNKEQDNI